ncbi:hypothetical protein ACFLS9_07775 [Bacteroidota bacterium]
MKKILFVIFPFLLLLFSCSPAVRSIDTSVITYKFETLTLSDLQESKIGVLPVLAGEGFEGFRRVTGQYITNSLKEYFPNSIILSHSETLELINEYDLVNEYSDMMISYSETAILNKETLAKLGEVTDCDYLLYSKVYSDEQHYYSYVADINIETRTESADISAQLWDIELSDIVWEGIGSYTERLVRNQSKLGLIIENAADGLAMRLGKSSYEAPASHSKSEIHESHKSSAVGFYILGLIVTTGILLITL